MSTSRLRDLQSNFRDFIVHGRYEDRLIGQLRASTREEAAERLDVYRNAFFIRLEAALAHDFPLCAEALGAQNFARLAGEYVLAQPSRRPSLRYLGLGFPGWLRVHASSPVADLAAVEWAVMTVFDGPDRSAVNADRLAAWAPHDWAGLQLELMPTLTLLALASNADRVWLARGQGKNLAASSSRWIAVSRAEGFRPRLDTLDAATYAVLAALCQEPRLAVVSERLAQQGDATELPQQIARALHTALAHGWVAAVGTTSP